MIKEQITIRTYPLIKIGLTRLADKNGSKNLNDYINNVLENHVLKKTEEEKLVNEVKEIFSSYIEEMKKELKETKIELEWNKKLLAKLCANTNINAERS
ncbi:hypothetical protein ACQ1SO_002822 [Pseudomonas aeruginosa]|uniref:hypothetical protein n=1 Tax=Enterobacter roggenkampii TaxID=1812935 RepID=UPI003DAF2F4D